MKTLNMNYEDQNGAKMILLVECFASKRGKRGDYGEQMEPDYPGGIKITNVFGQDGDEIELTTSEMETALEFVEFELENDFENNKERDILPYFWG